MIDPSSIREKSIELGFSACGFARAEPLCNLEAVFNDWIGKGFHGEMDYMKRNIDLRLDPELLFPGSKTVIVLAASYYNEDYHPAEPLKVSRYAVGRDYHKVLKKKGQGLIDWMAGEVPGMKARVFADSAPIMEKEWARRAGLGWIGKNTCLIMPGEGSWVFLAVILTDLEIEPGIPEERNLCGTCSKCIDACPTRALHPGGYLISGRCISYLTIELKDQIPDDFFAKTDKWLFGCDICQEACPWNRFAKESTIVDFTAKTVMGELKPETILQMDQAEFDEIFSAMAIKRAGLEKLKKTTAFLNDGGRTEHIINDL